MKWLRVCKLLVEVSSGSNIAIDLSQYRVKFRISQSLSRRPCTAEITVYNVAEDTAANINVPNNTYRQIKPGEVLPSRPKVILIAGYEDGYGEVFQGELWWKTIGRESQTDTYLRLFAAKGSTPFKYEVVSESIPAGATQDDIFEIARGVLKKHDIPVKSEPILMQSSLPRGKVIYKNFGEFLSSVADSNNFEFGVGNDGLVTVPKDGSVYEREERVIVLTPDTGLIGRPTITPEGVEIRALLSHEFEVGRLIQIENSRIIRKTPDASANALNLESTDAYVSADGIYRILSREHVGDTRGSEWYTNIKCAGIHAGVHPYTPKTTTLGAN